MTAEKYPGRRNSGGTNLRSATETAVIDRRYSFDPKKESQHHGFNT
jgi:hypothetical protein